MQREFDKDKKGNAIIYNNWYNNASEKGVLAYKMLIQTGNPVQPTDYNRVCLKQLNLYLRLGEGWIVELLNYCYECRANIAKSQAIQVDFASEWILNENKYYITVVDRQNRNCFQTCLFFSESYKIMWF